MLSGKSLQAHPTATEAENQRGNLFRTRNRVMVKIILHPPILPAHGALHRLHPPCRLRYISATPELLRLATERLERNGEEALS